MRRVLLATLAVAFVFLAACASARSTKIRQPVRIRACEVSIVQRGGELIALYRRALIVGEVEGAEEWWIDFPDEERVRDADGRARAVNVPKSAVLQMGELRIIGTTACRCPPVLW